MPLEPERSAQRAAADGVLKERVYGKRGIATTAGAHAHEVGRTADGGPGKGEREGQALVGLYCLVGELELLAGRAEIEESRASAHLTVTEGLGRLGARL
jgi:hypothetical protein